MESRKGILIAEDEHTIRNLLKTLFELDRFTVYQAADGLAALELFKAHADDIALLITDLGLPKLGGVELIGRLKSMKPTLRVVAISGYGHDEVKAEVKNAGGDEFLPKPLVVADLLKIAERLLGGDSDGHLNAERGVL
jgi:DNA-binding response OmpR family regulator